MKFSSGEYAHLAKGAYTGSHVKGWTIDKELSGKNHTTYVKNGHAVVAFSGTRKTHMDDWKADAAIAFGTHHRNHRFHEALNTIRHVRHKYGHHAVETTGHSLGGSLGMYTSDKLGVPAMVFQPGVSPLVDYNKSNYSMVEAHVNENDPISNSAKNISSKTGITVKPTPQRDKGFWSSAGSALKSFSKAIGKEVYHHPGEVIDNAILAGLTVATDGIINPAEEGALVAGAEGTGAATGYTLLPQSEEAASELESVEQEASNARKARDAIKTAKKTKDMITKGVVIHDVIKDAIQAGQAHDHDPNSYPRDPEDKSNTSDPNDPPYVLPDASTTPNPNPYATSIGSDGTSNTYYSAASQYNYADTSVGPRHAATYQPYARTKKPRAHPRRSHRQGKGSRRSVSVHA